MIEENDVCCGALFCRVKQVPYDAYLPMLFDGEEFSIGARMWTYGYDFYAPNIDCIFHQYGPSKSGAASLSTVM